MVILALISGNSVPKAVNGFGCVCMHNPVHSAPLYCMYSASTVLTVHIYVQHTAINLQWSLSIMATV